MTTAVDLDDIVAREPFTPEAVVTGSTFERARLRDGRKVVLKHLSPDGNWLTRMANGLGRARALWEDGVLERVRAAIDHPILAMRREDDHDVVVMEDVSEFLVPWNDRIAMPIVEELLGGLADLHREFEDHELTGLCTPADRQRLSSPAFHRNDVGPFLCPFGMMLADSWEYFAEQAPDDVVRAVFAVHDDPEPLGTQLLEAGTPTLLHGDAKADNMGLRDGRLILIDWGEITGTGPAEMDVAWFAAANTFWMPGSSTWSIDVLPDELFRVYETRAGRPLDPRALDLACIGMLAQCGGVLSVMAVTAADSDYGPRAVQLLDWWVARVRRALETWSPT
jgi:hypothetical protein